jgi:hypothetical protein
MERSICISMLDDLTQKHFVCDENRIIIQNLILQTSQSSHLIPLYNIDDCYQLNLFTTIQVHDVHFLRNDDCSLTPRLKCAVSNTKLVSIVSFVVTQGELPDVCFQFDRID